MNSLLMQGAGVSTRAQHTLPPLHFSFEVPSRSTTSASVVRWPGLSDWKWGCTGHVIRSEKHHLSHCSLCVSASSTFFLSLSLLQRWNEVPLVLCVSTSLLQKLGRNKIGALEFMICC
ncbi:hypothetical protein KP509_31G066100 [Ceratopteris richardii]|uniref:Uncharacterized protein n=1 Tax=Ceratopteris richardii TaxID=49495 RepID=A0A8T2QZK2_CERRI|nr:hypothetical protein KP509_31G066100 [Ceratopteris richardii]